ncbi:MAG: ABC transporter substrate-binding protein [Methanomicrobiaceae archaeon]|nr:ABC transporter substrate-binding protein [Methanomicrobiaceae archaeon]
MDYCIREGLNTRAVKNGRIFNMVPGWDFGIPRWILGLMHLANILHPELFLESERKEYYMKFYRDSETDTTNRSFVKYLP